MTEAREVFHVTFPAVWSTFPMMKVGDTFQVGTDFNPFFNHFESVTPATMPDGSIGTAVQACKWANDNGFVNRDVLSMAVETMFEFVKLSRELILENVRRESFPDLPSRQRCIWVVDDLKDVRVWANRKVVTRQHQVVKLLADGSHHVADERLMPDGTVGLPDAIARAHRYWKGEMTEQPVRERMFCGTATVLEVVKSVGKGW